MVALGPDIDYRTSADRVCLPKRNVCSSFIFRRSLKLSVSSSSGIKLTVKQRCQTEADSLLVVYHELY